MSIKTFDSALDFVPEPKVRTTGAWASIVAGFEAISEGISIAAEYKELTNRGMNSEAAARKVFEKIGTKH
jgi:hypothetical protein